MKIITTKAQENEVQRDIRANRIKGNEKIWSYLTAHILTHSTMKKDYLELFCGGESITEDLDVWYEAEPIPPRIGEGNTKLDLAFGSIKGREGTQLGIEYDDKGKDSLVCFIEAKFLSDCSTTVSKDPLRNQIIRVIENLLCFQTQGKFPKRIHFTLLTPKVFQQNRKTRLYGYKMEEYQKADNMLKDIQTSKLNIRDRNGWVYPEKILERAELLKLNWVSYEEILEKEFNLRGLDVTKDEWQGIDGVSQYFKKRMAIS